MFWGLYLWSWHALRVSAWVFSGTTDSSHTKKQAKSWILLLPIGVTMSVNGYLWWSGDLCRVYPAVHLLTTNKLWFEWNFMELWQCYLPWGKLLDLISLNSCSLGKKILCMHVNVSRPIGSFLIFIFSGWSMVSVVWIVTIWWCQT